MALIAACGAAWLSTTPSSGEERKFLVMLAHSPKSVAPGTPFPLPNAGDIWDQYFDLFKNSGSAQVDSFAEYWREISYGNVSVSGDVLGWIELPWALLPPSEMTIPAWDTTNFQSVQLQFIDLNNNNILSFGDGEGVPQEQYQLIDIDLNGSLLPNPGDPNFRRTLGLVDFRGPNAPSTAIWTPGERFQDLNGNGVYDAYLEPARDGYGTNNPGGGTCAGRNGRIAGGIEEQEYCDLDGDGEWDFPEPFEDFLRIWDAESDSWIILDPSPSNTTEGDAKTVGSRAWAEAYIKANYPGDKVGTVVTADASGRRIPGTGFLGRFGNGKYDGPDRWAEAQNSGGGSKLQWRGPGSTKWSGAGAARVPAPDETNTTTYPDTYSRWQGDSSGNFSGYQWWWLNYWLEKFAAAEATPLTLPDYPPDQPDGSSKNGWPNPGEGLNRNVPNLRTFIPQTPNPSGIGTNGDTSKMPFEPNCGGTNARVPRTKPSANYDCPTEDKCDPDLTDECVTDSDPPVDYLCITVLGGECETRPPLTGPPDGASPYEKLFWVDAVYAKYNDTSDPNDPNYLASKDLWVWMGHPGDGYVDALVTQQNTETILPDELDRNSDGIPDRYDGPAEYDDLPSSIYHARTASGLGYGGDDAFGEVTSVQRYDYEDRPPFGMDIGDGDPGHPPGADDIIPPAGPGAYHIHGSNGYDAGNMTVIEFLTWMTTPDPAYNTSPPQVMKRDYNLDGLLDMGEVRRQGTENYGIDDDRGTPNDGGPNQNYPFNRLRITEDTVEALDSTTDWDNFANTVQYAATDIKGLTFINGYLIGATQADRDHDGKAEAWAVYVDPVTGASDYLMRLGDYVVEGLAAESVPVLPSGSYVVFYGSDVQNDVSRLIKAAPDKDTGEYAVTVVGNMGFASVKGLDFVEVGPGLNVLLGVDTATDKLIAIDTTTGAGFAAPSPLGFANVEGLAFDSITGTLYGSDTIDGGGTGQLITINLANGVGTAVGPLGYGQVKGLACDWNGTLYGTDTAVDQLLTIDRTTGAAKDMSSNRFLHSVILLPPGLYPDGLAAGGRGLFQLPAPGMDLPISIHESADNPISPIYFSDFVSAVGGRGENGQPIVDGTYGKGLMAHEWLHVWEGYPDLYDYDEYISGVINYPVGVWDIMSGSMVHPAPPLKQDGRGIDSLGTGHEPWLHANDLTDFLEPYENSQITLTDYAFDPNLSAFYFQNTDPDKTGEFFYFYRDTRVDPGDPDEVNFNRFLPGDGFLIMHTDFGTDIESMPIQQHIGSHFTYNIIQADGLQQLENGENIGDAGDPWPGGLGRTAWSSYTDPSSRWWGQVPSGLSIRDVAGLTDRSIVTFNWFPMVVPAINFIQPPGGVVNSGFYRIRYDSFDFYGGTRFEFYADTDGQGYDGWRVGCDLNPADGIPDAEGKEAPGFVEQAQHLVPVDAARSMGGLEGDGVYYFYVRLVPGPGQDGQVDPSITEPRARLTNTGYGFVRGPSSQSEPVVGVDAGGAPISRLEQVKLQCTNSTVPGVEVWKVEGTASGIHNNATTGVPYTTTNGEVSFKIIWDNHFGQGDNAKTYTANGKYYLRDLTASFPASEFKPGDSVRIIDGPSAVTKGFYKILSVEATIDASNPAPGRVDTLRLATNPGTAAGGVSYRVRSFTDGSQSGGVPDCFSFITTGFSAYSLSVQILNGEVVARTTPVIDVTYPDEATNPGHTVPLRVIFDASRSVDERGQPNTGLSYRWAFGDGGVGVIKTVTHTYDPYQEAWLNGVKVTLTVTNPSTGATGTVETTIAINPGDRDRDGVIDYQDNCPSAFNPDQADTDLDGVGNLCDGCLSDPTKTAPGICGCGVAEADSDGDGFLDCLFDPTDPNAVDSDHDGVPDSADGCPHNPGKTEPGICGCDVLDLDHDGDGILDCDDNCPFVANPDQADADSDGMGDACDRAPNTPAGSTLPANCGAGAGCGPAGVSSLAFMLVGLGWMRAGLRRNRRSGR